MAKKKDNVKDIEVKDEVVVSKPKKETKLYPLKKATKIGSDKILRPVGYKIALTNEAYRLFKQKNIV